MLENIFIFGWKETEDATTTNLSHYTLPLEYRCHV